jgi:hypothetical protein
MSGLIVFVVGVVVVVLVVAALWIADHERYYD